MYQTKTTVCTFTLQITAPISSIMIIVFTDSWYFHSLIGVRTSYVMLCKSNEVQLYKTINMKAIKIMKSVLVFTCRRCSNFL